MATPLMHGFDISHWNTVTNEAVIPRYPLMSAKATEGGGFRDPKFGAFWSMFKRLKAKHRGAFHWIRSDASVTAQVNNFLGALQAVSAYSPSSGLEAGALIQLDWEITIKDGKQIPPVPVAWVEEWIDRIQQKVGDRVIVYSADWVPGFPDWRQRHPDFPLWYSNFKLGTASDAGPAECARFNADLWQWTDEFLVPGFAAGIDGNMILDGAVLERVAGIRHLDPAPPSPAPIGDTDMDSIAAVMFGSTPRQHLFMVSGDGTMGHVFWNGTGWITQSHGGHFTGAPGAVVSDAGAGPGTRLDLFGRGDDGGIWQNTYIEGRPDWDGWHRIAQWP
jgi:GH25 family lysozyme M1 (1,4-beta-N-acetylmuramidase)